MSISVEQFYLCLMLNSYKLLKSLMISVKSEIIIDVLTEVGIDNLSISLLGELGRAYNNNDKQKKLLKYLRLLIKNIEMQCGIIACPCVLHGSVASTNHEAYTSENMKQMLALVDQGVRLAQD